MRSAGLLNSILAATLATPLLGQVYTPPPQQTTPAETNPSSAQQQQTATSPFGQEVPLLDPAAETVTVAGITIPLGDSRVIKARFEKYLKILEQDNISKEQIQQTKDELHKSFATLTQEEQKYANIFLHDIESGNVKMKTGKTFRDYITEYQFKAKNAEIYGIVQLLGIDETKLRNMMNTDVSEKNINEFGRFDDLKGTIDKSKAKVYFEKLEGKKLPAFKVNIRVHNLLQAFIIRGGFEV